MQTLLLLPGDGVGPEVIAEARRVAERVAPDLGLELGLLGGASIDAHGEPLTAATLARARASNAILMGAVGGPKWEGISRNLRPEAGLLGLRKGLDVYANLRPAVCFPALADASALKRDLVEGLDIMIVRELTSGVYFGEPRGIETLADGTRRGLDSQVYTSTEIRRVARVAFELARSRPRKNTAYSGVLSCDKANVMETGVLWREEVTRLHAEQFSDVPLAHMYADACAMHLVRAPRTLNVILADNLFGDILSDEAAMLTGSIGMLPSAALGDPGTPGLYEPVHGSAPDIAGQGVANPCAAILSLEMALRWSLDRAPAADRVRQAVERALASGAATRDIGGALSTRQMGDAVLKALDQL
ncbi:3-isopropylmalate dehydrogenase [bacterium]|nr:3-isopropylmalate dehydrogenase [bacterium]